MTETPDRPGPFRVADLAERWQCSTYQIRKMIDCGILKAFSISLGNKPAYRIAWEEVERWERENAKAKSSGTATGSDNTAAKPLSGGQIKAIVANGG